MSTITPWGITATAEGRVFAFGHPSKDYDASPIFEIKKTRATLLHTLTGVEGILAVGRELFCAGGSFEDGPQMHIYNGKAWTTHASGDASIHELRVVGKALVGAGRDGAVARWDRKKRVWALLSRLARNVHLTGIAEAAGAVVVCGSTARQTGLIGVVAGAKLKAIKIPTKEPLLGIHALADGQLIATGKRGTVLVGTPERLQLVPSGGRKDDFGAAVEWNGRVLIPGRGSGVVEYVDGALQTFSKTPAQRLAVTGDRLWRLAGAALAWWNGKTWAPVPLTA